MRFKQITPDTWQAERGAVLLTVRKDSSGNYWPVAHNKATGAEEKTLVPNLTWDSAARRAMRLADEAWGQKASAYGAMAEALPGKQPQLRWHMAQDVDNAKYGAYALVVRFDASTDEKGWLAQVWDSKTGLIAWASSKPCARAIAWGLATRAAKRLSGEYKKKRRA
jgi:hypothetical protein